LLDPDPGVGKRLYFCEKSFQPTFEELNFFLLFHDIRQQFVVQQFIDVKNENKSKNISSSLILINLYPCIRIRIHFEMLDLSPDP